MSSETLHEDPATLGPEIIDQHRAIVSLMEELEAVDWYNQRAKATVQSRAAGHPRAQSRRGEGARGHGAGMAAPQRSQAQPSICETYLFTEAPVTEIEAVVERGRWRRSRRPVRRQSRHRQPATGEGNEPSFSRQGADHAGRLGRDREGSQAHLASLAGGAPRRRFPRAAGLGGFGRRARPRRSHRLAAQRPGRAGQAPAHPAAGRAAHSVRDEPRRARRHRPRRARSRPRQCDGGGARDRHRRGPLDLPRLCCRAHHRHLPGARQARRAARLQPRRLSRWPSPRRSPGCATTASMGRSRWC